MNDSNASEHDYKQFTDAELNREVAQRRGYIIQQDNYGHWFRIGPTSPAGLAKLYDTEAEARRGLPDYCGDLNAAFTLLDEFGNWEAGTGSGIGPAYFYVWSRPEKRLITKDAPSFARAIVLAWLDWKGSQHER